MGLTAPKGRQRCPTVGTASAPDRHLKTCMLLEMLNIHPSGLSGQWLAAKYASWHCVDLTIPRISWRGGYESIACREGDWQAFSLYKLYKLRKTLDWTQNSWHRGLKLGHRPYYTPFDSTG